MLETKKTLTFAGVSIVLLVLAVVLAPDRITPEAFMDQGEAFFPDFQDPNAARTLEVIEFNRETGEPVPFKVTFKNGRWTIPSHHDYPADGEERLAKTAAGVIGIVKDEFRSNNVSDHEAFGVLDPLDESASLAGRGTRVTIKGENDQTLADFIIGNEVEGRPSLRYVRVPGQNRVYAARMDIELSTSFSDWIDKDLLQVSKSKIEKLVLKDYRVDERTLRVEHRDMIVLTRKGSTWEANKTPAGKAIDTTVLGALLTAVDSLSIVGVRTKPEGLSAGLKVAASEGLELTREDLYSLQEKGFYIGRDGSLLSNDGELQVFTSEGIIYSLRFGELVYGSGLAISAGGGDTRESGQESGENRYLFITAEFDNNYFDEPSRPTDESFRKKADSLLTDGDKRNKQLAQAHDAWKQKMEQGRSLAERLTNRFANWYYVISAESYDRIHVNRSDLVVSTSQS